MTARKNFLDRYLERFDSLDSNSRQSCILRLARERGFFETVFNAVDEGILVIDRSFKLRYFNRAARDLLALPEDWSELSVSKIMPGIDWRRILQSGEKAWSRVARQEMELLYPEHRFVQFYLVPLPEDTDLAAIMLRDVTESRSRTMDEMESQTGKAVSLLAAGVAHEIGNPLNSLYLNLQILEQDLKDSPLADAAEMISVCKSEVERLDSIIHGFLTAVRPGKGAFLPVDPRQLIVETLNFMRPEIEARHVEVKCSWAEQLPQISGDASQLKQAFYNLIRNAVQAMTNGGTLDIYGYLQDDFWILEFADSGHGVKPEEISVMFNAFKTTRSGGNGIGTMIIERVCREHGAQFGLVSSPGRGTVFQIKFPLGGNRVRLIPEKVNA